MNKALAIALTAALAASAAQAETAATATNELTFAGIRYGNPIDPSTWWDASVGHHDEMTPIEINPMDPDFWMSFIRPESHSRIHRTVTNPATMAQFLTPDTYIQMASPQIWAKWIEPDTFDALVDPQTYAYWMQPGAYKHVVDAGNYGQMLELDNYAVVLDTAMQTLGLAAAPEALPTAPIAPVAPAPAE